MEQGEALTSSAVGVWCGHSAVVGTFFFVVEARRLARWCTALKVTTRPSYVFTNSGTEVSAILKGGGASFVCGVVPSVN